MKEAGYKLDFSFLHWLLKHDVQEADIHSLYLHFGKRLSDLFKNYKLSVSFHLYFLESLPATFKHLLPVCLIWGKSVKIPHHLTQSRRWVQDHVIKITPRQTVFSSEVEHITSRLQQKPPIGASPGYTRVYPKVSGLAAWSENCKCCCISLPLGAVVSLFCESVLSVLQP
jgi:hypothetical protein